MKHLALALGLALATLAAPRAVLAGGEVFKCVDDGGHITLTDQACDRGTRATRLVGTSDAASAAALPRQQLEPTADTMAQPAAHPAVHPLSTPSVSAAALSRQQAWRARLPVRARPLASDVATLRAAHAQLLLADSVRTPRPVLATLR